MEQKKVNCFVFENTVCIKCGKVWDEIRQIEKFAERERKKQERERKKQEIAEEIYHKYKMKDPVYMEEVLLNGRKYS